MLTHLCITMFTSGSAQKKKEKKEKRVLISLYIISILSLRNR